MLKGSDVYSRDDARAHAIAIAELYEAHFERVWRWLHGMGVRPADLEDATQEVFVVVHRRYADFDHAAQVTTWLFGIALRVASGFRRRAHVRREEVTDDVEAHQREAGGGPDARLEAREAVEIAQRILDGLDENKRAVFVLYELEGVTLKDIAATLGVPLQTAFSRLAAARQHFQREAERLQQPRRGTP